jgi:hypothetical protein
MLAPYFPKFYENVIVIALFKVVKIALGGATSKTQSNAANALTSLAKLRAKFQTFGMQIRERRIPRILQNVKNITFKQHINYFN